VASERVHKRRRTAALGALAVLAVVVAVIVVSRLSGREETPKISGTAKDVVTTVMQFETALSNRDWAGICSRLYSADARQAAGGARCATTLAQSAGGLRNPRVRIISVTVRGQQASVRVAASVNGKPAVIDTIALVREGGRFRIASAGAG
jgi:hypothetical protein